jgi:hypothetical protein
MAGRQEPAALGAGVASAIPEYKIRFPMRGAFGGPRLDGPLTASLECRARTRFIAPNEHPE